MSRLQNLIDLQNQRRIGNTTFMMKGLAFDRPAIMLFATIDHAKGAMHDIVRREKLPEEVILWGDMHIGKVRFGSIHLLTDANYKSLRNVPIMVDHFALDLLVKEERKLVEEA